MHLLDEKIPDLLGRPPNFTKLILRNWTRRVEPDALVIDLGDTIIKTVSQLPELIKPLPGRKIITLGNHDPESYGWFMERGYDFACDYYVWYPIVFSHQPLPFLPPGCLYNIHGHLHNNPANNPEGFRYLKPWHKLFSLELEGYGPVRLSDFARKHGIDLHSYDEPFRPETSLPVKLVHTSFRFEQTGTGSYTVFDCQQAPSIGTIIRKPRGRWQTVWPVSAEFENRYAAAAFLGRQSKRS